MDTAVTDLLDQFHKWHDERHEYARQWKKKTGRKVVGTFCTYVPEEIIYAAGALPVRILGSHEPGKAAEQHILSMYCFFCRDTLTQGLEDRYDYLDGIVIAQSCLHMRQAYHSWRMHRPVEFSHYINMPHHVQSPRAKPYLAGELARFKKALEDWLGRSITDENLNEAIEVMNTHRRLMARVYQFRKTDRPPLTGLEAVQVVVSSQTTDKREHNQALADLAEVLPGREPDREPGIRLMMVGSESDDLEFIRMIEDRGATIVIDDHCTGSRYFWNEVVRDGSPLQALADRYVDRVPCPSKDWPESTRFEHILGLADEYKVQGVLLLQQKFCDPHEADNPLLMRYLKENGQPSLLLELAATLPVGQFQIRVEAFLEMLREEDLF